LPAASVLPQLPRAIHPTRLAKDEVFLAARPSLFSNLADSPVKFTVESETASQIF
jgi:hypothetical protein